MGFYLLIAVVLLMTIFALRGGMGNQEKVTYVKMTPDKVASIVSEHLVNGRVVTEYTIGAAE